MSKDGQTKRYRNYATVLYVDSCPPNFMEIISDWKIQAFLSPYHDKDVNPDGEPKKPHYHLLIMFEGPKSEEQVKELFAEVNGVGIEIVKSLRSYARYLCHLDNPEKFQYFTDEVWSFGGADFYDIIQLPIDDDFAIGEMMEYCVEHNYTSFARFAIFCKRERPDWFRSLRRSNTLFMSEFLKSLSWSDSRGVDR